VVFPPGPAAGQRRRGMKRFSAAIGFQLQPDSWAQSAIVFPLGGCQRVLRRANRLWKVARFSLSGCQRSERGRIAIPGKLTGALRQSRRFRRVPQSRVRSRGQNPA